MHGLSILLILAAAWTGALAARVDALGLRADAETDEGARAATAGSQSSPCEDSLFVALKSKPIGSMTPVEYTYFMAKSGECFEYEKGKAPPAPIPAVVQPASLQPVEAERRSPKFLHAAIVGAMLAAVVYLVATG
jgi:hypothetical protein